MHTQNPPPPLQLLADGRSDFVLGQGGWLDLYQALLEWIGPVPYIPVPLCALCWPTCVILPQMLSFGWSQIAVPVLDCK